METEEGVIYIAQGQDGVFHKVEPVSVVKTMPLLIADGPDFKKKVIPGKNGHFVEPDSPDQPWKFVPDMDDMLSADLPFSPTPYDDGNDYVDFEAGVSKNPQDHYFQIADMDTDFVSSEGYSAFYFTPRSYFDKHKYLADSAYWIPTDLGFGEVMESVAEFAGSYEEGRNILLAAGFVEKVMWPESISEKYHALVGSGPTEPGVTVEHDLDTTL